METKTGGETPPHTKTVGWNPPQTEGEMPRGKLKPHVFSAPLCPEERGDFMEFSAKCAATKTTAPRSPSTSIRSPSRSIRSSSSRNLRAAGALPPVTGGLGVEEWFL